MLHYGKYQRIENESHIFRITSRAITMYLSAEFRCMCQSYNVNVKQIKWGPRGVFSMKVVFDCSFNVILVNIFSIVTKSSTIFNLYEELMTHSRPNPKFSLRAQLNILIWFCHSIWRTYHDILKRFCNHMVLCVVAFVFYQGDSRIYLNSEFMVLVSSNGTWSHKIVWSHRHVPTNIMHRVNSMDTRIA